MPPDPLLGVIKGWFQQKEEQLESSLLTPGDLVLERNSWTYGSSSGDCPRSLGSSAQDCGQRLAASRFHLVGVVGGEVYFTLASFGSSKVTCLLGMTRLGEAVCLWPGSSGQSAGKAVCPLWLLHLLLLKQHLLLEHLLLPECHLLPEHWQLAECSQLLCHPQETEQSSCLICPLSITTAASTQQWVSLATLLASSLDCCCQSE